jgi:hypothetical protein
MPILIQLKTNQEGITFNAMVPFLEVGTGQFHQNTIQNLFPCKILIHEMGKLLDKRLGHKDSTNTKYRIVFIETPDC